MPKVIIVTSDKYFHLHGVFFHLWEKYWGGECEMVGHATPPNIPDYCTFVSLGKQGQKWEFADSIRKYIAIQPQRFVFLCEDSFLKSVDFAMLTMGESYMRYHSKVGKFNLTNEAMKRRHTTDGLYFTVDPLEKYKLSTQPAIWDRDYMLRYLKSGHSIWDFETQPSVNDGFDVMGFTENVVSHNEGTRRQDIFKLNLDGFDEETLKEIKQIYEKL